MAGDTEYTAREFFYTMWKKFVQWEFYNAHGKKRLWVQAGR